MTVSFPDTARLQTMRPSALLLCALTAFTLDAAAAIPPAEKLLPADTLAVVSVPDFIQARETYLHSPQAQLWRDPAMKPFLDKFLAKVNSEFIGPLEKDLGVTLTNYTPLPQGQITLALVQNGWEGGVEKPQPGWVLLLDAREKSALLKSTLSDLRRKWTDDNRLSRTEKIRGVEFTVLKLSTNNLPSTLQKLFPTPTPPAAESPAADDKKAEPASELFIGQSDSLLIAGNQMEVLLKVLTAQAGGGTPTLGEQPVFEANRLALFRDAPMFLWINAASIVNIVDRQLAKKAAETAGQPSFLPIRQEKIISATGLDALKSIAFSVHINDEGSAADLFLTAPESERRGLLNLVAGVDKETRPPAFVPADAVKFQRLRFNTQKTWDNLESVVNKISPQMVAGLNFAIEMAGSIAKEKNPEYNLKQSILTSLGDDIITYQKAPRSANIADIASPPSLMLIGTPKSEQLVQALKYLFTGTNRKGQEPKEREFLGRKIFSIDLSPVRTPDGKAGPARSMNFVAASSYVALSGDPAILEEFLRSADQPGKPLREVPGLDEASRRVAASRSVWFAYENQAETMRHTLAGLKENFGGDKPNTAAAGDGFGLSPRQKFFKEWMDVSLLPEFDPIARYFSFTVSAGNGTPEGISFKMFSPTPPRLKGGGETKQ
jgi:hypothetical protein